MTIRQQQTTVIHGPNGWSQRPVVIARIDASGVDPDGIVILRDSLARDVNDREAPGEGVWRDFGTIVEVLSLEMQQAAGEAVADSASRQVPKSSMFDVAVEFHEADVAIAAIELSIRLVNSLLSDSAPAFELRREFDATIGALLVRRIGRLADEAVIRSARERHIPMRIPGPSKRLIEFGMGPYRRWFRSMATSQTTHLGASIASDKSMVKIILRELGLPVPEGISAGSRDEALAAASSIGYPVVVKPLDRGKGIGVSLNLQTPASVSRAYGFATSLSRAPRVVIERHIPGKEYRILVVADQVVAVCERMPAFVTGDGKHTIRELVSITNAHPWRGPGANSFLAAINIDQNTADALESQDLTLDSVPDVGRHVAVKLVSNVSQGGVPVDRTDEIHPETARLARTAAKAIGIDVCGLDLVTDDIAKPLWESGGAFLEVNATPGGRIHLPPHRDGRPNPADAIMDMLFPPGAPSRPQIVAVCGHSHAAATAKLIASMIAGTRTGVGLASSGESTVGGRAMLGLDRSCDTRQLAVLRHPDTQFAVLEIDQTDFEAGGLPFDYCDVAVILDQAPEVSILPRSLYKALIDSLEETGTLIHHTDFWLSLPDPGKQRAFTFSTDNQRSAKLESQSASRNVAVTDDDRIVVTGESGQLVVMTYERAAQACGGAENEAVLAAIATAIALEIPVPSIEDALERDSGDPDHAGRSG